MSHLRHFGELGNGSATEFESDGTLKCNGDATTFMDEKGELVGRAVNSVNGRIYANFDELTVVYKTTAIYDTDFVGMAIQLNHYRKLGAKIFPHLHWEQAQDNIPNWVIAYRYQIQGQEKNPTWTVVKWDRNVFTWNTGTLNQIVSFGRITPPSGDGPSDILELKLYRDTNDDTDLFGFTDPYDRDVHAVSLDVHIEVDCMGSHTEYVK